MKKVALLATILMISLFVNVVMLYNHFSVRKQLTAEPFESYAASMHLLKQAKDLVDQATNETGPKQQLLLFNTLDRITEVRIGIQNFDEAFIKNGVQVAKLETLLGDIHSYLREETAHGLIGQEIDQKRIQFVQQDLKYMLEVLPPQADDMGNVREAFEKVQHHY